MEAKGQELVRNKGLVLGFVLAAFTVVCLPLAAAPAHAADFTVNSTADDSDSAGCQPLSSGDCTLREAIEAANADLTSDTINFNIPGAGLKTIATTGLPPVTRPLTIDGYTQPGATQNTSKKGTNALLLIELDGSAADGTNGLEIRGGNTTVRGLVINNFAPDQELFEGGSGILLASTAGNTNNVIEGNFIGTDSSGSVEKGNAGPGGIFIESLSTNNRIGGVSAATRNLISANEQNGILLTSSNNTIQGNLIGTDSSAKKALGNGLRGVFFSGSAADNNTTTSNTIAFNGAASTEFNNDGVAVQDGGSGNRISRNAIFANGGLGIDLTGGIQNQENEENVSANDPDDADAGPNRLQNFPEIKSVKVKGKKATIKGTLQSTPGGSFSIEFFSNTQADPSGNGEGKTFVGESSVSDSDEDGSINFTFKATKKLKAGQFVSATATNEDTKDTSEFSRAVTAR